MTTPIEKPYQLIRVVDDDQSAAEAIGCFMQSLEYLVETYISVQDFLEVFNEQQSGCLIIDVRMPGMSGIELQKHLEQNNIKMPIIFISGHGSIPMAVQCIKNGALDFLTKPINNQQLLDAVNKALRIDSIRTVKSLNQNKVMLLVQKLTPRELEIMGMMRFAMPSKKIASILKMSANTVDVHKNHIFKKMQVNSLSYLIKKTSCLSENPEFESLMRGC